MLSFFHVPTVNKQVGTKDIFFPLPVNFRIIAGFDLERNVILSRCETQIMLKFQAQLCFLDTSLGKLRRATGKWTRKRIQQGKMTERRRNMK